MYMEPIVRTKPAAPVAARRLAGIAVLLLGMAVMLPWLAAAAMWTAGVMVWRAVVGAPRAMREMVDYAGGVALGR